ncbi:hypothetical protein OH717_17075 [Streptomyces albidoflavus]|uniref:hypothetical protein n=1 Tax=Streptomyces koyangensis TaxID=188770 RepID=UPI003D06CB49|nr:hypothetical protein OH717_17075 [Streptomyces albidoflavus]
MGRSAAPPLDSSAVRDLRDPGEHGRGLLLVHQLAAAWGVAWPVPRDRNRKTVWFTLDA